MSMQITNTRIYTVPSDSESDSDYEDYKIYTPKTRFLSQQQESHLIKLGCVYNPAKDYKRSHLYKNPVSDIREGLLPSVYVSSNRLAQWIAESL